MAAYPYMVQTASNVLTAIFKEWQQWPYRWIKERDLLAEIGGRLNSIFSQQGLGEIASDYKWVAPGFDSQQTWSRVSFEPYVQYEYEERKSSYLFPDIVIWDDLEPETVIPQGQLWPILWACELKYGSRDDGSSDVEKLNKLLEQGRIKFGCAVRVHFEPAPSGIGVAWSGNDKGRHLWICDVRMPASRDDDRPTNS